MSQIQIRDAFGVALARINIRIAEGQKSSDEAIFDVFTDLAGNTGWPIPFFPNRDYTLFVNDANVDERYDVASVSVGPSSGDIVIALHRRPIVLSRLVRISGHRMVNEHSEPVYGRGASMFLLYKKYLDMEDITPQLAQLQSLGCNLIRVMGMFESLGGFNPKAYGDRYYTSIPSFVQLCERYGIYVYWCACAATGSVFSGDEAIEHIRRTAEQMTIGLFSPVNEQGQHNNSIDVQRAFNVYAPMLSGKMLFDGGSYGSDIPCERPFGTHAVLHVNRRYPNSVKDGCILDDPNYIVDHLQVGLDEPDRYGDDGNMDVEQCRDAAGTAYTALLWCFHSLQGERGEVFHGNTLDCANAAFGAMAR